MYLYLPSRPCSFLLRNTCRHLGNFLEEGGEEDAFHVGDELDLLNGLMQPRLLVQLLHVGHGHSEEQVHDHDGHDQDEDGQDEVGCEGEVLGLVDLVDETQDVGVVGLHNDLGPGVVEVVVLDLTGHHDHHLDGRRQGLHEGDLPGEEDNEGEGEPDDQGGVGHEEVDKAPTHVHQHLHVLAEPGHLSHQEHLQHPRDEDPESGAVELPARKVNSAFARKRIGVKTYQGK